MSSYCIDYFATLGRKSGPLIPTLINDFQEDLNGKLKSVHPTEIWLNCITDIAVLIDGEEVPDETWEICDYSADGVTLMKPHIAYRRRKHSKRQDHITEVIYSINIFTPIFNRLFHGYYSDSVDNGRSCNT